MKIETEVKFFVDDFRGVRPRLEQMKARLIWKGKEHNVYLDHPKGVLKRSKKILRLRSWEGYESMVTVKSDPYRKRKKDRYGDRAEQQTVIGDFKEMHGIFHTIGFIDAIGYKKRREHWRVPIGYVELDALLDGRRIVEVEATRRNIDRIAKKLGLDWKRATTKSYPEIIKNNISL